MSAHLRIFLWQIPNEAGDLLPVVLDLNKKVTNRFILGHRRVAMNGRLGRPTLRWNDYKTGRRQLVFSRISRLARIVGRTAVMALAGCLQPFESRVHVVVRGSQLYLFGSKLALDFGETTDLLGEVKLVVGLLCLKSSILPSKSKTCQTRVFVFVSRRASRTSLWNPS